MAYQLGIPDTKQPRVVVAGGGFGGVRLVKRLKGRGFQVVLLDRNNYHTFQPLLYQVATGGLEPDSIGYPIRKIFHGRRDFYFRMARITGVQPEQKIVQTDAGDLSYDFLVLAVGTESNYFGMNRLAEHAIPLKSMNDAMELRNHLLLKMERALRSTGGQQTRLNVVIAGGGPTGVELAGALSELKRHVLPSDYPELDWKRARIVIAEAGPALLAGMSQNAAARAASDLSKMEVEVRLNTAVRDFDGTVVTFADNLQLEAVCFIWSAGMKGIQIPGIPAEVIGPGNRIRVDRYNMIGGNNSLFALGDLAFMEEPGYPKGHPMVAQVAIQQAVNLARNLDAIKKGSELKQFHYKNLGSLATIGRGKAVVDFPFLRMGGFVAWLLWLVIHLMTLVGFRNRLVVFVNWMWNYFSYDSAIRLIFSPFQKK